MYSTGSGSSIGDLLGAVKTFTELNGWTTDHYAVNDVLATHKGICYVNFKCSTTAVTVWDGDGGSSSSYTDGVLRMALATGYNSGISTYYGQTGSPSTTNNDPHDATVGNLHGPFVGWFMFSDPALEYIHVVVQTAAEIYTHFSFGFIDPKGLSHGGVAYAMGHSAIWYQDKQDLSDANSVFNSPAHQLIPFCGGFAGKGIGAASTAGNGAPCTHYAPDALPSTLSWPDTKWGHTAASGMSRFTTLIPVDTPVGILNVNRGNSLLDPVIMDQSSHWSGYSPLWTCPCIAASSAGASQAMCYVGDYPNVRLLEMTGLVPQQELPIGGDTWRVYPILRQENWATADGANPSTGQFALAYKKVL